jgi:hypothetical protein
MTQGISPPKRAQDAKFQVGLVAGCSTKRHSGSFLAKVSPENWESLNLPRQDQQHQSKSAQDH